MWIALRIDATEVGLRLDQALPAILTRIAGEPFSRGQARGLIDAGGVYLAGKRCRMASKPMRLGATLTVAIEQVESWQRRWRSDLTDDDILALEADLCAVNKPAGMFTQGKPGALQPSLELALGRLLHRRAGSGGELPHIALHHRLDRETSGVVVVGLDPRANRGLAAAFRERLAEKRYVAVVHSPSEWSDETWSVDTVMGPTGGGRWGKTKASSGRPALSHFKVLGRSGELMAVEARPMTGRTHQIRVHLADCGLPVVGDEAYGTVSGQQLRGNLMLHALSLSLPHPVTKRLWTATAPIPARFPEFVRALAL